MHDLLFFINICIWQFLFLTWSNFDLFFWRSNPIKVYIYIQVMTNCLNIIILQEYICQICVRNRGPTLAVPWWSLWAPELPLVQFPTLPLIYRQHLLLLPSKRRRFPSSQTSHSLLQTWRKLDHRIIILPYIYIYIWMHTHYRHIHM